MSDKRCHVHGCNDPVDGTQIELHVPLDPEQTLSELTVRTWVCRTHRTRFVEAGLHIQELSKVL